MKLFFCNSNVSSKLGFKPSFSRFFSGFTSKELIVNSDINNVLLYDGNNFKAVLFLPSLVAFLDLIIDEEFRAGQREPKTKEEIYSAMIVLGFLS